MQSTKLTDRSAATAFALEIERTEKLAGAGSLVEAQATAILKGILERAGGGETLRTRITSEWLRSWIEGKEATKSTATGVRYKQIVEEFIEHLGHRAKKPLSAVTTREIQAFLTKRTDSGCSPTTVQLDGKILRTAFNRARREGLITTNPAEAVELPERDSVERGTFTPAEVKILINAAKGEWKTMIYLAYFTGARLGDCCRMEWESVDLAKGLLTYKQTKTGKTVLLPIHPQLLTHLETLAVSDKAEKFVMPGMANKGPGGRHGLSEGFKRIMEKAGVDFQQVDGSGKRKICRRTFHALRHSFTSVLANADVAPELRMKLTGHSSQSAHKTYSHHDLETLRRAVDKMPRIS
ncbi:MAG: site-specific integrase [Verrucomicrobiales bacterium]|nr:site-specific integrase [Verrucomicrobiales bacterium]